MQLEQYMSIAIQEAEISLREGNNGIGTVIVKDGSVISASHDREDTENDATSHAEINAIREASRKLGRKLSGCVLISTHEPCPMCAAAIVWAGIAEIAFGCSVQDAVAQGRKRINLPCFEVFKRAGVSVRIHEGVLKERCLVLYRKDVRSEIEHLRNANIQVLSALCDDSVYRRTTWFHEQKDSFDFISDDLLDSGYQLLLRRFHITEKEAPIIEKTENRIVFHSMNFCPTLEACRILDLDTRHICRELNEASTDALLKQLNTRLSFSRNYNKLRPYAGYCEEIITLVQDS